MTCLQTLHRVLVHKVQYSRFRNEDLHRISYPSLYSSRTRNWSAFRFCFFLLYGGNRKKKHDHFQTEPFTHFFPDLPMSAVAPLLA